MERREGLGGAFVLKGVVKGGEKGKLLRGRRFQFWGVKVKRETGG